MTAWEHEIGSCQSNPVARVMPPVSEARTISSAHCTRQTTTSQKRWMVEVARLQEGLRCHLLRNEHALPHNRTGETKYILERRCEKHLREYVLDTMGIKRATELPTVPDCALKHFTRQKWERSNGTTQRQLPHFVVNTFFCLNTTISRHWQDLNKA